MIEFLPSPCDPDCLSLTFGWIERILEVPRDCVGNVLADSGLNLLQHDTTTPTVEHARAIAGLKQYGQGCLEFLVVQVVKLNFYCGMDFLVPFSEELA